MNCLVPIRLFPGPHGQFISDGHRDESHVFARITSPIQNELTARRNLGTRQGLSSVLNIVVLLVLIPFARLKKSVTSWDAVLNRKEYHPDILQSLVTKQMRCNVYNTFRMHINLLILTLGCQDLPRVAKLELLVRCTVVDRSLGTTPARNKTNQLSSN